MERRAQSRAGGEGRRRGKEREADEGGGRVAAEIADDNFITTRNARERGAQSEGEGESGGLERGTVAESRVIDQRRKSAAPKGGEERKVREVCRLLLLEPR